TNRTRRNMKFDFRANLLCAALVLTAPPILFGQNAPKPIATVDGQAIYEQDLMSVAGSALLDLRNQEYKLKSDALNTIIRKKLIEAEAQKKGITTEELLKQEVDSQIPEPSDAEAKGYYLGAKNQSTVSFDTVKPQIKELLRNVEIQQARGNYEDSLRARAEISIRLQPPSVHLAYD